MKSLRAMAIAVLLCGLARPGAAAPQFVYETPGEFISSGDFNGDGVLDVLVLDKISGNARVGYADANGNLTWSAPLATGVQNPTGAAVGRFQQTGYDTLASTSPSLNSVNLVDLSHANSAPAPVIVTPPGLGPHALVPLANPAGAGTPPAYNSLLVASSFNSPNAELLDLSSMNSGAATLAGEFPESGPFDQANALQLVSLPGTLAVGMVSVVSEVDEPSLVTNSGVVTTNLTLDVSVTNTELDIWQFASAPGVMLSLSNLPTGSFYTFGVFNGEALPRFIFYQPGGTNLTVVQLLQNAGVYSFGTPLVTNVSEAIAGVFYLNRGADGSAMIQFSDGVEGMSLPGGVPMFATVYKSGEAAGNIFTGVAPLGNGQFALLDGPAGSLASSHSQVIHFDGTNYAALTSTNLPATTARNTRANVWLFQTEPFVNRQPGFIASFDSPDWTESVSGLPGGLAVKTDPDNGTSSGLGSGATNNLGAPPTGSTFGLVNQYSSSISVFSYGGTQPPQPVTVTISPPPGLYDGPIAISFSTLPVSELVYYRVGSGDSWHQYAASFTLTNDNTIQYYGTNSAQALRSQLQFAAYTLGKNNDLATQPGAGGGTNSSGAPSVLPGTELSSSVGTIFYGRRSANTNGTIWAINLDGSDDTFITTGVRPRVSKDGLWLAFLREGDPFNNHGNLWVRNMQTGVEQRLLTDTNEIVCYDWEPDDSGLVVDYNCGIMRLGTNGVLTPLVSTGDCFGQAPVLSPRDGRIAYHDLFNNPSAASTAGLYVATFSGSFPQRITTNISGASWPEWSPDGGLLSCSDGNSLQSLDGGTNLWVVARDGSTVNRICDFSGTSNRFPHGAVWTPDGTSLVGAATLYETNGIWIVPLNADRSDCGGEAILLPTTPGDAIDFVGSIVLPTGKPVIVVQPASVVVGQGQPASVSVTATGSFPLHYEWIKDGVLLPNQNSNTLNFPNFQLTNTGIYKVVVTNGLGMALSFPARVSMAGAPLRGWGNDNEGELGDNMPLSIGVFTNRLELLMGNVVASAEGDESSMFLTANGTLFTTGYNVGAQLGLGVGGFPTIQAFDNDFRSATNQPFMVTNNVVDVAAGNGHNLFITADGNLWAMGDNSRGELGVGTILFNPPQFPNVTCLGDCAVDEWPAPLLVAGNVVAMAAGENDSFYVTADGNLWAMGANNFGQLGIGSTTDSELPVNVASNVVAVAAGEDHSLFLQADGTLWAMGYDLEGAFGDGATNNPIVLLPKKIASNVVTMAAGFDNSMFVTADGILHVTGNNEFGALGIGPGVVFTNVPVVLTNNVAAVAAEFEHTLYIAADGSLWGMGQNGVGQLGIGTNSPNGSLIPVRVNGGGLLAANLGKGVGGDVGGTSLAVVGKVPIVAAFSNQTVLPTQTFTFTAVYTDGDGPSTIQWQLNGVNISGATSATYTKTNATIFDAGLYQVVVTGTYGSGSNSANLFIYEAPSIVSQPTGSVVLAGQPASVSVTANITLPLTYEWMKDGVLLPGQTNSTISFPSFQLTDCGAYQVVIVNADGLVISVPALMGLTNAPLRVWGYNASGELGDGTTVNTNLPVLAATSVVTEAAGESHSLFVKSDGTLWGMGYNQDGELGNGKNSSTNVPIMITNNVVAVAAGTSHSLFLKADGTLWGMGANEGQLGDGTFFQTNRPTFVTNNVVAMAAGDNHSLFITAQGTLWATGYNGDGQLGSGNFNTIDLPVAIATNVVSVAAGANHSLFVTADGTLWSMGYNLDGELGNGNFNNTNRPVAVTNNVVAAVAGNIHSLFLKTDGTLWGMGSNGDRELTTNSGNFLHTNLPVMITTNVATMTAAEGDTLYLTTDGKLFGIGFDEFGELGDGGTYFGTHPALVNGGGLVTAGLARGPMAYHTMAVSGAVPVLGPLTNLTVLPTQPFSFTAMLTAGDGPFAYQWQLNTTNIPNATNAVYSVGSAFASNSGTYTVTVIGAYGSASASATLNVNYLPIITAQPSGSAVAAGQPASASVTVGSYLQPVTYEWIKDGVMLPNQTSNVLSFPSFQLTNSGAYQVVAANAAGIAISEPVLLGLTNAPLRAWGYNDFGQLGDSSFNNTNLPVLVTSNVVTEAVGGQHSLYVTADRKLWTVGDNQDGELGETANTFTDLPVNVATNVVAVAAGAVHSLYLTADGRLWTMGQNASGQLGDNGTSSRNQAGPVASNVVAVAAGSQHSLYVTGDGTLWAMGDNTYGELGNGTSSNSLVGVMVTNDVVAVTAGGLHSLFLKADGTLWGMGYNGDGELGDGGSETSTNLPEELATNVIAIAAGSSHSLYVTSDGNLWAMGFNGDGELGDGGPETSTNRAEVVTNNVVAVAGRSTSSVFVKSDGSLWSMGDNTFGELGRLGGGSRVPVRINGGGTLTASVAKGSTAYHNLAVVGEAPAVTVTANQVVLAGQSFTFNGVVTGGDGPFTYQWQLNTANISSATNVSFSGVNAGFGAIGTYTLVVTGPYGSASASATLTVKFPPAISAQPTGSAVSLGQSASLSVAAASQIAPVTYQWLKDGVQLPGQTNTALSFASFQLTNVGSYQVVVSNADGLAISVPALLGVVNAPLRGWGANGSDQLGNTIGFEGPLPAEIASNVVLAAAGNGHSLYVTADGKLWGLGYNGFGQLGNGTFNSALQPVLVTNNVVAAAAGESHSLFVTSDGKLWTMGNGQEGQLGAGAQTDANLPVMVATNVVAVGAGSEHSLYVTADGKLWAMGNNHDGELGDGTTSNRNLAVMITNSVVSVAAGGFHSLFVKVDRTLWAMGFNGEGELGNSNFNSTSLPVSVASNVLAAAAGDSHSLYITADDRLWGMGYNFYGQLGNGQTANASRAVMVATNVVAAAAGAEHSLYITGDGSLWAMGYNGNGQLGDNDAENNAVLPVMVNAGDMLAASVAKGPEAFDGLAIAGAAPLVIALSSQTVFVGDPFFFSPTFEFGADYPAAYQWQLNGANIPGATNDFYSVDSAATNDAGVYSLVVTGPYNSTSSANSNATLTVLVHPPPPSAPVITMQPISASATLGQPASVSVTVSGTLPITYEWLKDGVLLPNQTSNVLSFPSFQLTNSGAYQVVLSNSLGFAISMPALVGVANAPLRAWGNDNYSQLGDGNFNPEYQPELVTNNVLAEAVGSQHSLFVTADGTLWAVGYNQDGELGDLGNNDAFQPEPVATNVVAVAAGEFHSLYVTADGTLWAMGQNANGQLGDGGNSSQDQAEPVATNVVAVAAGGYHSLYLTADGRLWAMGADAEGQLGDGMTADVNLAEVVTNNVVSIAAGEEHSLFIKADGTLWAMGDNTDGELGDGGSELYTNLPEQVTNNVVAVAAGGYHSSYGVGGYHSLFVTADGTLWAMGYNGDGELGDGGLEPSLNVPEMVAPNVVSVAAGAAHSLYVTTDGNVWAMGDNMFGELGNFGNNSFVPQLINGLVAASLAKGEAAFHALAVAGELPEISLAYPQVTNGQSYTFSATIFGGDGPFTYQWQSNSVDIPGATNSSFSGTDAESHGGNGYVYSGYTLNVTGAYGASTAFAYWFFLPPPQIFTQPASEEVVVGQPAGLSAFGYASGAPVTYEWLKDGVLLPAQTGSTLSFASFQLTNSGLYQVVVADSAGIAISLPARLGVTNAPLRVWGADNDGQLGDGTLNNSSLPKLTETNIVAAAAGGNHSLYLSADGNLWAMGENADGQLGDGAQNNTDLPVLVTNNVLTMAAGGNHSLFVTAGGTLWAMGRNSNGQLGNGTSGNTNLPTFVANNVVAVSAGNAFSLYLTADGNLWATGQNADGQLGNGFLNDTNQPVMVTNNVVTMAAGGNHSLFVTADGKLWAMGRNTDGQLGDSKPNSTNLPVMITTNVLAAAAGDAHSLFVTADGKLWAMGRNSSGQLGDGKPNSTNLPVMVTNNVLAAAAGAQHSEFVSMDGRAWAMGQGSSGQLGDGVFSSTNLPVLIDGGGLLTASLARGPEASHGLAVAAALPVISGLTNLIVNSGQPFAFNASVTSADGPYTSQWQLNGANISGATNTTYNVTSAATGNVGTYTLLVTVAETGLSNSASAQAAIAGAGGNGGRPVITSESAQPDGFHIHVVGATNAVYYIAASTNLQTWVVIGVMVQTGPTAYDFVDTNSHLFPRRFYRAQQAVIAPPTQLRGAFSTNGTFRLQFSGAGSSYTIFASSNLVQWIQLGPAVPLGSNLFQYIDASALRARFYRVRSP